MGIWLCGVCFKTHTTRIKCRHGADFVSPPDIGDGVVRFVIYDLAKPLAPSCSQLDHVDSLLLDPHDGLTLSLLDSLFSKGLRTVKFIPPKCRLGFSRVLKGALDKVISKPDDISCWVSLLVLPLCLRKTFSPRSNLECKSANKRRNPPGQRCKRKIYDGHYTAAVRVLSSSGVAPYNDATLQELKTKHPFMSALSLPDSHIDHHPLIAYKDVVLEGFICVSRSFFSIVTQHLMDCLSGVAVAISDELVSSITQVPLALSGGVWSPRGCATMIGHSLDGYLDGLQFGVGVPEGGESILHVVNRLVEDREDDVGLSMLLVDFQNAFNLALPDYTTEEPLLCVMQGGLRQGDPLGPLLFSLVLHPLICKIRDSFNLCLQAWYLDDALLVGLLWLLRLEGVFPPNISRPLHGVKLLGGPVRVDVDFGSALVMKRVSKTIGLLDDVSKINDPQCELFLIRACAGVSKLYFAMCTCPPRVFEAAQLSFDMALRSALEPLQTKLLRHVGLVAYGSTFDDALCVFNASMKIDFLCNPSEIAAPKLMKKMADIYFTRVAKDAESSFSLSPRQMALWLSQREEHTSD
ncbi:hypothetical protein Tco_0972587 [Tanacetum coccineum]